MSGRASLFRMKCMISVMSLGLLSSTSFANKHSLSHKLRVKARWHAGLALPVGIIGMPILLGFIMGPALTADAIHFKSEADLLKAAYIVQNKNKKKRGNKNYYSRKEIRDSERIMDEYYDVKLAEKFPYHQIPKKEIIEALAFVYESGATYNALYDRIRAYDSLDKIRRIETLTQILFGDINTVRTKDEVNNIERQKYYYETYTESYRKKLQQDIENEKKKDEAKRKRDELNQEPYEEVFTELEQ